MTSDDSCWEIHKNQNEDDTRPLCIQDCKEENEGKVIFDGK